MTVVPFVSRADAAEHAVWLSALNEAAATRLPGVSVRPLTCLDAGARSETSVVIVADPDPGELARLPKLQWVQSLWAGVERLVAQLPDPSVAIVRMRDPELARTMAEAVLAWTLYLHRDMPAYRAQQKARIWRQLTVKQPGDVTVGVLGLGVLGRRSVQSLLANGFQVQGWSRSPVAIDGVACFAGQDGLHHVLAQADIVIVLLPLTPQTRGLIDHQALSRLKPGASLINFARGPIIVEADLMVALDEGRLQHAVLDVFDREPLPQDHPFWIHPAVTVLPHISAPSNPATASRIAIDNVAHYLETGVIPDSVDRQKGY